jgi:hypothetical protein
MRPTLDGLMPAAFAIAARLQWVAFGGVALAVLVSPARFTVSVSGALREGRVLSRRRPSIPSSI